MPDFPALQDAFDQPPEPRPGCGVPVARLLGLFQAGNGLLRKPVVAPLLTHALAQVQAVHPSLQEGDVLVADRGLCSYAYLALLVQAGVHAVLRSYEETSIINSFQRPGGQRWCAARCHRWKSVVHQPPPLNLVRYHAVDRPGTVPGGRPNGKSRLTGQDL